MNLQFLRYFVLLAEYKNFTKAAEKIPVVQSTFSAGIKKLEEHLDTQLFYRDKRNVSLTVEGQALLPRAKQLLKQWNDIEIEFQQKEHRVLRVGKLDSIIVEATVPLLKRFQELYGQCQIELKEGKKEELLSQLDKQELDAVFLVEEDLDENTYGARRVYEEVLHIAVNHFHPLANKEQLELSVLHGQPFIERTNCALFSDVHAAFSAKNIATNTVFSAQGHDTVTSLVASGVGVSLIARPAQPVDGVRFIPIADEDFRREVMLLWRKDNESSALQNFLGV